MRHVLIIAALCLLAGCVTAEQQAATPEPSAATPSLEMQRQQLAAADHAKCAATGATGYDYQSCRNMLITRRIADVR